MDLEKIKLGILDAHYHYQKAYEALDMVMTRLEAAVEAGTEDGYLDDTASGARAVIDRMSVVYNEKTKLLPSEIGWLLQYVRGTFER